VTTDTLYAVFLVSYALTGAALGTVLALGRRRVIRGHIAAVVAFAIGFGVVLVFAESLGRRLVFDPTIERIHMAFAFTATAAVLGPLVTGWRRLKGRGSLRAHHVAVATFLVLFVGASVTGGWMLSTGNPR
jgi:hypothetical protein